MNIATTLRLSLCALTCLAWSGTATADPGATSGADAKALREAAADAYSKNDFETCQTKATEALTQGKEPQTVGLLGLCQAELKVWRDAAENLDYATAFDPNVERKARYAPKLEEAKKHVGVLRVTSTPGSANVHLDGADKGAAPKTLFVSAGHYTVELSKAGFEKERVEVDVLVGEDKPIDAKLEPVGHPPPPGARPIWPLLLGGGIGVAGAVVGGVLLGLAEGASSDASVAAQEVTVCDPDATIGPCATGRDAIDRANNLRVGGYVAFGVAGTGVLVGAILFAVLPPSGEQPKTGVTVVPMITTNFLGASLVGAF